MTRENLLLNLNLGNTLKKNVYCNFYVMAVTFLYDRTVYADKGNKINILSILWHVIAYGSKRLCLVAFTIYYSL